MNKKFFTLMAAALIGGAAMPSEAFAQTAAVQDSTVLCMDGYEDYAKYKLQNGLKFILQGHTGYANDVAREANAKGTFFLIH